MQSSTEILTKSDCLKHNIKEFHISNVNRNIPTIYLFLNDIMENFQDLTGIDTNSRPVARGNLNFCWATIITIVCRPSGDRNFGTWSGLFSGF